MDIGVLPESTFIPKKFSDNQTDDIVLMHKAYRRQSWAGANSKVIVSQRFELKTFFVDWTCTSINMIANEKMSSTIIEYLTMPMTIRPKDLEEELGLQKPFEEK